VLDDWAVRSWKKRWAGLAAGIAAGLLAAGTGAAAEQGTPASPAGARDFATNYPPERLSYQTPASELIGTTVFDRAGHKLGKIEDFVVDWNSGRVYCALLWPQNLYGASNYFIAVPAKCFVQADESEAVINTNVGSLIGSARFVHAGWDAAAVSNSVAEAYRRFGQPLSWDEKTGPGALGKYSSLLGTEVNNRADVNIGNLADLVFDLPTERIMFAVISFYGEDENEHAVPFSAMGVAADRRNLVADVDDSMTGALVNPDDFLRVEITDPYWVAGEYGAYGKQPGFDAASWEQLSEPKSNVVINLEAQQPAAANPEPAPAPVSEPGDVKLSRAVLVSIVQADMDNAALMQNVTVTTANGVVTLTGHVPSEAQKSNLEKIAVGVEGVGSVRNELEVK
jgi:sporulation protein YlmC with PRC-barrel domain